MARVLLVSLALSALLLLALVVFLRWPSLGRPGLLLHERASPQRLARHVNVLAESLPPRDVDHPENLERAAVYVEESLRTATSRVASESHTVGLGPGRGALAVRNLIASFGPEQGPRVLVGAHYDAFGGFGGNPGADDNASGTAGLTLALAEVFAD